MSGNSIIAVSAAILVALNTVAAVVMASAGEAARLCKALCEADQRELAVRSGLYVAGSMVRAWDGISLQDTMSFTVGPYQVQVICEPVLASGQASSTAAVAGATGIEASQGAHPVPGTCTGPDNHVDPFLIHIVLDGQQIAECVIESSGGVLSVKDFVLWSYRMPSRLRGH